MKLVVINILLLAGLVFFNTGCRPATEKNNKEKIQNNFPYGQTNSDVKITFKQRFQSTQKSIFNIKAGEISGLAILTPVSDVSDAQSMVDSEFFGIKRGYENMPAPYGGEITTTVSCSTQKYIREEGVSFAGKPSTIFLAVASARKAFGICSIDQIKYASAFWVGFDEKRSQVVTIKLFRPIDRLEKLKSSHNEILNLFNQIIK